MVIAPDDSAIGVSISPATNRAGSARSRSSANRRGASAATSGMPSQIA